MNNLRHRILQAFIFVVPLIHTSTKPDRMAQEDYFKYLGMCLVSFFTGSIWIALFMCLNVFLFIYHGEQVGLSQVLNVFLGVCIFIVSKSFFAHNKLESIKTPILILTFLNLLWMILQALNIDPLFKSQDSSGVMNLLPPQTTGLFGIKMANGTFLTLSSIFMMSNPIISFLLAIPIFLCQSSSVFLAYTSWICFWSYFKAREYFKWIVLSVSVLGFGFVIYDQVRDPMTFASRFPVWHSCIKKSLLYPLGYGPDSYRKIHKHKNFLFSSDGQYNHAITTPTGQNKQDFQFYSPTNNTSRIKHLTL